MRPETVTVPAASPSSTERATQPWVAPAGLLEGDVGLPLGVVQTVVKVGTFSVPGAYVATVGTQPSPRPFGSWTGHDVCAATWLALPAASTAGRCTWVMRGTIATSASTNSPMTNIERNMLGKVPSE